MLCWSKELLPLWLEGNSIVANVVLLFLVCLQRITLVRLTQRMWVLSSESFQICKTFATVSIRCVEQRSCISVGNGVTWNAGAIDILFILISVKKKKNIWNGKIRQWLLNWHFASTDLPEKILVALTNPKAKRTGDLPAVTQHAKTREETLVVLSPCPVH